MLANVRFEGKSRHKPRGLKRPKKAAGNVWQSGSNWALNGSPKSAFNMRGLRNGEGSEPDELELIPLIRE